MVLVRKATHRAENVNAVSAVNGVNGVNVVNALSANARFWIDRSERTFSISGFSEEGTLASPIRPIRQPTDTTDTATSWHISDDGLRGCGKGGAISLLPIEEESDQLSDVQDCRHLFGFGMCYVQSAIIAEFYRRREDRLAVWDWRFLLAECCDGPLWKSSDAVEPRDLALETHWAEETGCSEPRDCGWVAIKTPLARGR